MFVARNGGYISQVMVGVVVRTARTFDEKDNVVNNNVLATNNAYSCQNVRTDMVTPRPNSFDLVIFGNQNK
jgi:hypothetical protein